MSDRISTAETEVFEGRKVGGEETSFDVGGEAFRVVDGLFAGGVGVEVGAHVLHFELKLGLGALLRSLRKEGEEGDDEWGVTLNAMCSR